MSSGFLARIKLTFESMVASASGKVFCFVRYLRWLLLAVVCSVCVGLVIVTMRNRKTDDVSLPADGSIVSLQKFQTFLHQEEMQLRISGDSLVIAPMKFVGPFHLGIVYSLTVHNSTIETFPHSRSSTESATSSLTFDRFLTLLPSAFERFLTSAVLEQSPVAIVYVVGGPLTVVQHNGERKEVIFTATSCHTDVRHTKAVCQDGTIGNLGQTVAFRELSYDGRMWKLHTISGKKRMVTAWADLFSNSSRP